MTNTSESASQPAAFTGLVDLAAENLGGKALQASDEFFASKENLLKPGRGVFIPDKYTDNGKWMDGWETRRKRTPGHDWCIIQLGIPGVIYGIDIDTNHFLGNHPPYASLEACALSAGQAIAEAAWMPILERLPLKPGSQNLFAVSSPTRWTHVRLNIYPDGGVARLRVYGAPTPDWAALAPDTPVDLACVTWGGQVAACSDMFFSPMQNLILPTAPINMGDGWETRRRRGPGHDWVVVRLGCSGHLERFEVGTHFFKGNYPDRCSIDACYRPGEALDALSVHTVEWTPLLPETPLGPDRNHEFLIDPTHAGKPFSHVRLNVYPDGGISRFRVHGVPITHVSQNMSPIQETTHATNP